MTGPLTPPPTSAIEIEDEARNAAPTATDSAATQPPAPEVPPAPPAVQAPVIAQQPPVRDVEYGLLFSTLCRLAASGKLQELISVAEDSDISVSTVENKLHTDRLLIIIPLVLSYLIIDDIPLAQSTLARLPNVIAAHVVPQSLARLVASAAERRYDNIYPRAQEVLRVVQGVELGGSDMKTLVEMLLNKYIETFRMRTFVLLSKVFASIPLSLAQQYLGCPLEQVLTIANEYNWNFDQTRNVLLPVPTSLEGVKTGKTADQCTVTTLETLKVMDSFE